MFDIALVTEGIEKSKFFLYSHEVYNLGKE